MSLTTAPTQPRPAPSGHLRSLDGVRGVAILAVVAFHTTVMATRGAEWGGREPPPLVAWPLFAGKLGVDVFFVLSGLLVVSSWRRAQARYDGSAPLAMLQFAKRRARRILPPYWFSLLLLIPLRAPEWLQSAHGWLNIGLFASVQQFLRPDLPHHVNVVTWSLTTEVHFYVLLPLLAFLFARAGWTRILIALLVLSVAWRFAIGGTGAHAEWIFGRIDQFAAGMAAATLVSEHQHRRTSAIRTALVHRRAGLVLAVIGAAIATTLGATELLPKPLAFQATFHAVFGLVVAATLVRMSCISRRSILDRRWLAAVGAVSYSLYLWHWPLMMEASRRWGPSLPVLAGALGVAVVLTLVSYVLLERPFTRERETRPGATTISADDDRVRRVSVLR